MKSKLMRAATLLMVLTLMTSCFVGSTFAKYTSTASGSDTARVAKWSIKVEDTEIAVTGDAPTVAFDLFGTIKDTAGADEADVDLDGILGEAQVIAPGTSGSFQLDIENLSEVNAKYTITLTETNASNIPLQYSVDGTTWKDSIAELTMTALTDVAIAMETGTSSQTVFWRWVFEGTTEGAHAGQTDATDTTLGVGGTASVTITATITATQVD